jgi:hypothetical protein
MSLHIQNTFKHQLIIAEFFVSDDLFKATWPKTISQYKIWRNLIIQKHIAYTTLFIVLIYDHILVIQWVEDVARWGTEVDCNTSPSIIRIVSATRLPLRCMVKYCKLLVQNSSWWWTVTCSKHVEDTLSEIDYKEKGASCWSFSRMCITMHGSENAKFTR